MNSTLRRHSPRTAAFYFEPPILVHGRLRERLHVKELDNMSTNNLRRITSRVTHVLGTNSVKFYPPSLALICWAAQSIVVPRGRAPFGQHQESRPLGATILKYKGINPILSIRFYCAVYIVSIAHVRWSRGTKTLGTRLRTLNFETYLILGRWHREAINISASRI